MKILLVGNHEVLLDDELYEWANSLKLTVQTIGGKKYIYDSNGNRLHRMIMGANAGSVVDHINGNTMDNSRLNLRICTQSQNAKNRSKSTKSASSKYKGVHWHRGWMASIRVNYKRIYLGVFKTEEAAAMAYNNAAVRYHGEFAKVNQL
jgi:hypothetical protein